VDLFFFLGQVFLLSISVLLGLIMVTHLGPGAERRTSDRPDRHAERSKARAGASLLLHISQYTAKGFRIKRVTSDGEPAIKAATHDLESIGVELNVLGHGSHTPHAESAIRHVKNKARSTAHSLLFPLSGKLIAALMAFVVHTSNMIPKVNAIGHFPAHTAFLGRVPNLAKDAPFAFGTAGFLQRASGPSSNSAAPRGDYCIWLGTTHNLAGTHRCFNIDTLREVTGDIFRPAPLTNAAITRLTQLAGSSSNATHVTDDSQSLEPPEPPLLDPNPRHILDPNRGAPVEEVLEEDPLLTEIVPADDALINLNPGHDNGPPPATSEDTTESESNDSNRAITQAAELVEVRNTINSDYHLQNPTEERHIFSALTMKEARTLYGDALIDAASTEELQNCIQKGVWECLDPDYPLKGAIPSKMFLTPKKLPNGDIDKIKGRVVAGGHRQDRTLFQDSEISSPTVALTSVLAMAAVAAHEGHHVMTLDHKAAYLNAEMRGPRVDMLLTPEVAEILCKLDPKHRRFLRPDRKIAVKLKKALYGCIQSAVLWYQELASTLQEMGFRENPYDICSFTRVRNDTSDRILVYVDDLFITSKDEHILTEISDTLKAKYGAVTNTIGKEHNFLGIHWDFRVAGQVSLSMDGYVNDIIKKYEVTKKCRTPATDRLFQTTADSPLLTSEKSELFRSCVMTLYYLAKRTRPEILTAISYCATRISAPTVEDEKKLDRILSYLLFTKTKKMILRIGPNFILKAYVDASFGVYEDGKSVTGVVIMIGNATIYVKSGKQKIVTKSSTESEGVGISDALSQVLWTREYLIYSGFNLGPAVMYQDNMSTIFLANKGRSTSERSRHIKIRYFFVKHYIDSKEITIEYLPTGEMIADILTKPLHGTLFARFCAKLTGETIA
jgi:Reverse transcriptase (RNA-dependent DNA polymerase)